LLPWSKGFSIGPGPRELLLIAGGIGIAPLVFLAQQSLAQNNSVTLLLGAPTAKQLYPQQLLPEGIQTITTTEDGTAGIKGMVTDLLPRFLDKAERVYACGPVAMYQTIAAQSKRQQIKQTIQISLEVRLGCGLGACYGCTVRTRNGTKRICLDGPVFELDEIIWEEVKI